MKTFVTLVVASLFSMALMAQVTSTPGPGGTPEIDPSSVVTALALVVGAGVIVRSRFKRI